jgi:chromosomal replication initiator protein
MGENVACVMGHRRQEGSMARATDGAAAIREHDASTHGVRDALRERLGANRFAVWFGDGVTISLVPAAAGEPPRVVVRVGSGFTHEWLKRTFHTELCAAAREVCGAAVRVEWEATVDAPTAPQADPPVETPAAKPPQAGRARRQRSRQQPAAGAAVAAARSGSDIGPPAAAGTQRAPARRPLSIEEFVVGPSNRMALGAVEIVAARPGEMSPLVIHGPSGVGKTHLLEGVCVRARDLNPALAVVMLSAEQFTTSFVQSLHGSGLPGFRRTCRAADLLVIDDIQFLVGKRATLVEFQQTVDALHRLGKQMVFACDRELDALDGLGSDLLTRLRGGMVARILPPDYDVRRDIVAAIAAKRGLSVPDEVVHYVATHITRHARELYGAVNRLEATSLMLGVSITAGMAEEALADLVRSSARSVRLADIEKAICKAFGIEAGSLQSARRAKTVSHPRMLAMFLARKHTHAALTDIGKYFGRRSHSTVIAAQKTVGDWVAKRASIVLAESQWDVEEAIRRVEDLLRAG